MKAESIDAHINATYRTSKAPEGKNPFEKQYNVLNKAEMDELITIPECRKLREVVNTLTVAQIITKGEYVRLMVVINDILKRMEKEEMLNKGDKVVMNDKYRVPEKNKGKVFTVITGPQEVCGTMSVWLEGYRGCYAVDGLTKVEE